MQAGAPTTCQPSAGQAGEALGEGGGQAACCRTSSSPTRLCGCAFENGDVWENENLHPMPKGHGFLKHVLNRDTYNVRKWVACVAQIQRENTFCVLTSSIKSRGRGKHGVLSLKNKQKPKVLKKTTHRVHRFARVRMGGGELFFSKIYFHVIVAPQKKHNRLATMLIHIGHPRSKHSEKNAVGFFPCSEVLGIVVCLDIPCAKKWDILPAASGSWLRIRLNHKSPKGEKENIKLTPVWCYKDFQVIFVFKQL